MSLRNRLVLPIILSGLAALAGCGSTNSVVPPPSGAFSNTDFSGTYTFSVEGSDVNGPFMMVGSLTACGCTGGTISGGTVDFDDAINGVPNILPGSAIGSNSTYNIDKDGRGTANLVITPTGGTAFPATVAFVLTSSSHGLIIRYDSGGSGSGTIDLQPSAVSQSAIENTPYAFSLSGAFGNGSLATVGSFTLNSSGQVSTGVQDFNQNGIADGGTNPPSPYAITAGSVAVGSGTTPGSATLTTSFGTINFDVYAIDATHLKLIESDGIALLVGDVFSQPSASIPQGNLVFTMEGLDTSGNEFATGGLMASDGNSLIISGSEDINDDGTVDGGVTPAVPYPFSGGFSTVGDGRFLVTLTNFLGGTSFAAYPSSGGILMMEVDLGFNVGTGNSGVTSGVALAQTEGAAIAATQGYGLNNTGEDVVGPAELDEIAQFTTTSTGMTGVLNDNDGFALGSSNVNGTYAPGSNGAGSATIGSRLQSIFYYAADSSTVLFISTDPNQAASGVFEAQTAPSGNADQVSTARPRALPMLRALPRSRKGTPHGQGKIGSAK
ncbi:MAG: hypothetical protein ACLPHP_18550 [Candidatus Sulfotelmatobacter sp.]